MNKKYVWSIVIVIVVIIIIGLISNRNNSKKTEHTFKLGVIAPMTGELGFLGEELKKGIDVAVEKLNKDGVKIEAMYEDDKFDPKLAAGAANKLISVDKVDMAVVFTVEEARPVLSIFNNNKIPLISAWDSNELIKNAGPYIFSNGFSTEKAGTVMADYAYNDLKLRSVAILSHVDAWAEILTKAFEEQFKKNGGKIVYSETVQVGTDNYRVQISKIKSSKADGVYFPLIPFDNVSFVKQARENNLRLPLMTGDALLPEVVTALASSSEGIYFTSAYPENPDTENLSIYAQVSYDVVIKIGSNLNSETDVKTALDMTFGPTRSTDRVQRLYRVEDGKWTVIKL